MYLDSLGSLVLFMACGVGPVLIAYLIWDDLWQQFVPRPQPEPVAPIATKPAAARRYGWLAWS